MILPGQRRGNRGARCLIKQFLWTRSSWRCREQLWENKHPTSNLYQPRRDGQFLPYIRFCICCTSKNITPFLFSLPCLLLESQDTNSLLYYECIALWHATNYRFTAELVLFNLHIFYALCAIRSEMGVGFDGWFGSFWCCCYFHFRV